MTRHTTSLVKTLGAAGVDPDQVAREGGGLWAFGSRAAGCPRPDSDWDVLVVLPGSPAHGRVRCGPLDLVYVGLSSFLTDWRLTELATHVESHGICLAAHSALSVVGQPRAAARRKAMVVRQRVALLDRLWDAFRAPQRCREIIRLRRDLQRTALLQQGTGVPPSAWLDAAWGDTSSAQKLAVARTIGIPPRILRALSEFGELAEK